jgi:hypothetical protein
VVRITQIVATIGLTVLPLGLPAQGGVAVVGFETSGSAGLKRGDYVALGMALTALLQAELDNRGSNLVMTRPLQTNRSGQLNNTRIEELLKEPGVGMVAMGRLLDQYGDVRLEVQLTRSDLQSQIIVLDADTTLIKRDALAGAISSVADAMTSNPIIGGSPGSISGFSTAALLEFGRGLQQLHAGDDTAARAAFGRATDLAPGLSALVAAQRGGGE